VTQVKAFKLHALLLLSKHDTLVLYFKIRASNGVITNLDFSILELTKKNNAQSPNICQNQSKSRSYSFL
jgi:hypothetical protein